MIVYRPQYLQYYPNTITRSYFIHGHVHISHVIFSRYVRLTCFGPGTQEWLCPQDVPHPLSIFIPNYKSLIHSIYLSLVTYLRTIEISQDLGQCPVILTCFLIYYNHNFQFFILSHPWIQCATLTTREGVLSSICQVNRISTLV